MALVWKKQVDMIMQAGKKLKNRIIGDDLPGISAEMTFFLVLAFFPFILFLIHLLSFTHWADQAMLLDFEQYLPESTANMISSVIRETVQARSGGVLILAMLGVLWSSGKGMRAIIKGLNKAYDVQEKRPFIRLQLVSLGFVVALALIVILSMGLLVFGEVIGKALFSRLGIAEVFTRLWAVLRYGLSILMLFGTFVFFYRFGPNKEVHLMDVLPGSGFAVAFWLLTSQGFAFYVNRFANYQAVYGSLGGMIVLLLWMYISCLIILVGGEINRLRADFRNRE